MQGRHQGGDLEFAHYSEVLRRRWWLVALGLAAGVALAAAALSIVPKTYTSTTSVIVRATTEDGSVENGRTRTPINLDTEAQLVTSTVVADLALADLDLSLSPRELAKQVAVTVPPNTSVLDIAFSGSTPEAARAGAEAFAQAYLTNREQLESSMIEQQTKQLTARIQSTGTALRAASLRIARLQVDSAAHSYETAQRAQLVEQLSTLNSQLTTLASRDASLGEVISEAPLPTRPSDPNAKLLVVSGLLSGLLGGLLLAFLVDRADTRVRDRRDLERLGLDPLVGQVVLPLSGEIASPVGSTDRAETLRQLRNALLAQLPDGRGTVLVAATSPGGTGSAVAANLAATLARTGLRVVLVRANCDTGSAQSDAEDEGRLGLADLLRGRAQVKDVLRDVDGVPGLSMVTGGSDGSLYSELLQGKQLRVTLNDLAASADLMVVDVAPMSANADAQTLATMTDGALLVATHRVTRRGDVVEALDQLHHVSARLFGAVVACPADGGTGRRLRQAALRDDRGTEPLPEAAPKPPVGTTKTKNEATGTAKAPVKQEPAVLAAARSRR